MEVVSIGEPVAGTTDRELGNKTDDIIHPNDYQSAKNGDTEVIQRTELQTLERNRLVKGSDLTANIEPQKWLIKGIMPEEALVEFVGASGSYKSFILLDMMFCISAELPYHGLKTTKGTVIYIAGEGSNGVKMRLKALQIHYNVNDYDFYVLPMPSNLMEKIEIEKLAKEIMHRAPMGAAMVMFDTLHRNSAGSDENSSKDFASILGNLDTFIKPLASVVGWVHHTGLGDDAQNRGRGTSSRYAAMDTVILVRKREELSVTIENTKQKDSEPFNQLDFNMAHIKLGIMDEDNAEMVSLVPYKDTEAAVIRNFGGKL